MDINIEERDDLFVLQTAPPEEAERLDQKVYSFWGSVFREFFKKPSAIVSLAVLVIVLLFAIFGPMVRSLTFTGGSPYGHNLTPNATHWFGTDQLGRDIWTQVWLGTRTSLQIAFLVSAINIVIGIGIGALWGYFKKFDAFMIEFRNFINNIPDILIMVLLMTILTRGFWPLILALTITGWMGLASYVRNHIIVITNTEFNIASRTLGTKSLRMISHNILPYLLSIIVTVVANMIPSTIGSEVGLSYLGLGLPASVPTLGTTLEPSFTGAADIMAYPHIIFFPALVLALLTLSFFRMGITLADACDPKNHR